MIIPHAQDESDSEDDEYFSDEDSGPHIKRRKMVHTIKLVRCVPTACVLHRDRMKKENENNFGRNESKF